MTATAMTVDEWISQDLDEEPRVITEGKIAWLSVDKEQVWPGEPMRVTKRRGLLFE